MANHLKDEIDIKKSDKKRKKEKINFNIKNKL